MSEELLEKIVELRADHRGRVNLGMDYADQTVRVAVIGIVEDDD